MQSHRAIQAAQTAGQSAAVTLTEVQSHPEYVRTASLLGSSRKEVERLRSNELQLREELLLVQTQLAAVGNVTGGNSNVVVPVTTAH